MTTTPSTPDRDQAPSVAEIAALTRRLRDLSARGRDVDPAERAAFLADKRALLDRITGPSPRVAGPEHGPSRADAGVEFDRREAEHWERYSDHDPDPWTDHIAPAPSRRAVVGDAQVVATFDSADTYSAAQLANARAAGDTARAERLQDSPWPRPGQRTAASAGRGGVPDETERRAQLAAWHTADQADDLSSGEVRLICGPDPAREW